MESSSLITDIQLQTIKKVDSITLKDSVLACLKVYQIHKVTLKTIWKMDSISNSSETRFKTLKKMRRVVLQASLTVLAIKDNKTKLIQLAITKKMMKLLIILKFLRVLLATLDRDPEEDIKIIMLKIAQELVKSC